MTEQIDKDTGLAIIWILDAMSKYRRSRDWFNRRIANGRIREAPQIGTNRVYLILLDVEKEHAKGED